MCAKAITIADLGDFYRLSPEDFETLGPQTQFLNSKWRTFTSDVAACYEAYPGVEHHLVQLLPVSESGSLMMCTANFP